VKIFIGSSSEAQEELELIASWIEADGHEPFPWDDLRVFTPGSYTFSNLTRIAREVDAAVFIFSEDDRVWYRNDTAMQPRDNVMIEYGLFLGTLGEGRVIFCRKGKPKPATDVLGVVYVDITEGRQNAAKRKIRAWLKTLEDKENNRSTSAALARLRSPFQALGKRSLFLRGSELITKATSRITLVARTPIPLVGARPYDQGHKPLSHEAQQYREYWDIIRHAARREGPSFCCVGCLPAIKHDVDSVNKEIFHRNVIKHVQDFYKIIGKEPEGRCALRWHVADTSLSFLVADNDFMIWFKDSTGESVWITASNEAVADALHSQAACDAIEMTLNDVLNELGLRGKRRSKK
jgi:hypothetical protein